MLQNIDKKAYLGKTLRLQVSNNNISAVRTRLQDGVTSIPLKEQWGCIEISINNQNPDMLKVLLKMLGPNLNGSEHIIAIINKAIMNNNLAIVKTTLDYLAMYLNNKESEEVLGLAVRIGNVEIIKNVLKNLGTYISKATYQSLLRENDVSRSSHIEEIHDILIKFKEETKYYAIKPCHDNPDKPEWSLLNLRTRKRSKKFRQKIFNNDIERINSIVADGVTTIDYASIVIAVRIAIQNQYHEMLSILTSIPGFRFNTKDVGNLLKETILNNNPKIVQTLLEKLAPEINDKYAEESLLLAVTKHNVEVVDKILKGLGYKISIDCNESALQIAKTHDEPEIGELVQSTIDRHPATSESLNFARSRSIKDMVCTSNIASISSTTEPVFLKLTKSNSESLNFASISSIKDMVCTSNIASISSTTEPVFLKLTKSNSGTGLNTNCARSRSSSIEASNNQNMASTENNQRNDFKTGKHKVMYR